MKAEKSMIEVMKSCEIVHKLENDVKVDASKVPDVEWNCLCAVLLPLIRDFYELDEKVEAD